jgi:hypothetical protein
VSDTIGEPAAATDAVAAGSPAATPAVQEREVVCAVADGCYGMVGTGAATTIKDTTAVAHERRVRIHGQGHRAILEHVVPRIHVACSVRRIDVDGTRTYVAALEAILGHRACVPGVVTMVHAGRRRTRDVEVVGALASAEVRVAARIATSWDTTRRHVVVDVGRPAAAAAASLSAGGGNSAAEHCRWDVESVRLANHGDADTAVNS